MRRLWILGAVIAGVGAAIYPALADGGDGDPIPCESTSNCPSGEVCIDGYCMVPSICPVGGNEH